MAEPKKIPKKRGRKPKAANKIYWPAEVDDLIVAYNKEEDPDARSMIYQRGIRKPMEKLTEMIINTFKFHHTGNQTFEQFQHEVISFLVERLPKFKPENGKSFSYYSRVAKNYCILKTKSNYKRLVSHEPLSIYNESESSAKSSQNDNSTTREHFVNLFVEYWDINLDKVFTKTNDKKLAAAIVMLFKRRESIELFNKKALYIYIREITGCSTPQITKMVKVIKKKFAAMYQDYLKFDAIPTNKIY